MDETTMDYIQVVSIFIDFETFFLLSQLSFIRRTGFHKTWAIDCHKNLIRIGQGQNANVSLTISEK